MGKGQDVKEIFLGVYQDIKGPRRLVMVNVWVAQGVVGQKSNVQGYKIMAVRKAHIKETSLQLRCNVLYWSLGMGKHAAAGNHLKFDDFAIATCLIFDDIGAQTPNTALI
jgi:hypothetical protein